MRWLLLDRSPDNKYGHDDLAVLEDGRGTHTDEVLSSQFLELDEGLDLFGRSGRVCSER